MKHIDFSKIQEFVTHKLVTGLSEKLTYHHLKHTLDVFEQSLVIADLENVTAEEDLFLLKIGALYHDVGFLDTYQGHEEKGCEIAEKDLTYFGLTSLQKEIVFGLIRATRIPQAPETKLQQIICDADLDYLGRQDFDVIAQSLYQEFLWQGLVKNDLDWNKVQVKFLESHHYFTPSSRQRRNPVKQQHLAQIKAKVARLES
ncbi:HD domain-containing protein [Adhaeribacter radiodurans]|uniref:HD domain-containing protein n=1 Tax=Adhaeribacter radiodurans TaxID=2745197 RepID=A0A7L7L6B9_9BACT|nr:HD domain-containing protein [Adhaeribacter radiodurans]QMU28323.1 HD domain-containing protein [Adhaeribacter radiodurans]